MTFGEDKDQAIPAQAYYRSRGFQEFRSPRFLDSRHVKVVTLSVADTLYLYPRGNVPDTHFYWRLSRPQGNNAAEGILSMKSSNYTIGNRTCFLQACSLVPQQTARRCTPMKFD